MRQVLIFSLLWLASLSAFAQDDPINNGLPKFKSTSGSSATQTGAELVNVNQFTGTASVTIPVYDYSIAGLNLGVSLAYDTRGIRVDQIASEVGLGWNLNAGGSITRSVHGIEDDLVLPDLGPGNTNRYVKPYRGILPGCTNSSCEADKEFDVYHANFCGASFDFSFHSGLYYGNFSYVPTSPKGTWYVKLNFLDSLDNEYPFGASLPSKFEYKSERPLSVGFIIMNDKGDQFYFKRGDYQFKYYTVPGVSPQSGDPANTPYSAVYYPTDRWVLYRIITHKKDIVSYKYRTYDDVKYLSSRDETVSENVESYTQTGGFTWSYYQQKGVNIGSDSMVEWRGGVSQLAMIQYPNGTTLRFEGGKNRRRCDITTLAAIDSIVVVNGYGPLDSNRLVYNFKYSYLVAKPDSVNVVYKASFNAISSRSDDLPCLNINTTFDQKHFDGNLANKYLRLRLDSIMLKSPSGGRYENFYRFGYNNLALPNRMNPAQDHFGYFNGKNAKGSQYSYVPIGYGTAGLFAQFDTLKYSSIPLHTIEIPDLYKITYGVNKTPDTSFAIASNLMSVENGKRGKVELFYKAHSLSNPNDWYVPDTFKDRDYPLVKGAYQMQDNMDYRDANDGLCIDRIVYSDGYQKNNSTTTKYTFANGFRIFQGGYYWRPTAAWELMPHQSVLHFALNREYKNVNLQPQDYISGSNHGYVNVSESQYNYLDQFMGATKYTFTDLFKSDGRSALSLRPSPWCNTCNPVYFEKFRVGRLLEMQIEDFNHIPISKEVYTYPSIPANHIPQNAQRFSKIYQTKIVRKIYVSQSVYEKSLDSVLDGYFVFDDMLPNTHTTTTFAGSSSSSVTKTVSYDARGNIKTEAWPASDGSQYTRNHFWSNWNGQLNLYTGQDLYLNSTTGSKYVDGKRIGIVNIASSNEPQVFTKVDTMQSLKLDGNYETDELYTRRDLCDNILEKVINSTDTTALIWDTRIGQCIASVSNAQFKDVAYTSFEGTFKPFGTQDDNKGNWEFRPGSVKKAPFGAVSNTMTGKYYYQLDPLNVADPLMLETRNELTDGKKYVLTFWSTALPQVVAYNPGGNLTIPVTMVQAKQAGAWKLYTATFSGRGGKLFFINTGSGSIAIDELRLCPKGSVMTSSTYTPIFGVTSTNDNFNNITSFEYDDFGRLVTTKNTEGNIISVVRSYTQSADN